MDDLFTRLPKEGTACHTLLCAMQRGERLTEYSATVKYNITAASQRLGDLRRVFHWPVQSQFIKTSTGKSCKEYWMEHK